MKTDNRTVIWGYSIELVFAALVYILVSVCFGTASVVRVVNYSANSWAALVGSFWAFSASLFVIFFKLLMSEFGKWLSWKGRDGIFKTAFVFAMVVHVFAVVALIVAGNTKAEMVGRIALGLLILSTVNMGTLVINVMALVKLYLEFSRHTSDGDGLND